jgi:hypothetical protein
MKKFGTPDGGALGSDTDGALVAAAEPLSLPPVDPALRWWLLDRLP